MKRDRLSANRFRWTIVTVAAVLITVAAPITYLVVDYLSTPASVSDTTAMQNDTPTDNLNTASKEPSPDSVGNLQDSSEESSFAKPEQTMNKVKSDSPLPTGTDVGQIAPNFSLENLDGEQISLSDFRGNLVIVDFWASWCSPCRRSMPRLEEFQHRFADYGVKMIGISLDRAKEEAEDFLEDNGYTDLIALWGSVTATQSIARTYSVTAIPHTFVIDAQGVIRFSGHPNLLEARKIQQWL